ncbi:CvpA family protein [Candidatus Erwinia haradaeae]|uniref:Colicin V production protein n=1 Tax=Candidatus Erwinia haradaeae TaxID=1922217 RepID=A0A803FT73_9GAMM|nr:CvpA family protein [Candidatus Erwinia haradaeae]VFP87788.1 Colicin V production protein [Candidatus Erwinia haradaeae]
MIWIDYSIIAIISFSSFISLARGFVKEVISLFTWFCAFLITNRYYSHLAILLTGFDNEVIRNGVAIMCLFISILIVGAIFSSIIGSLVSKTSFLAVDKVLGVFFGGLRGILIAAAILFFLDAFTSFSQLPDWQQSQLIPYFKYITQSVITYLKNQEIFY